MYAITTPPTAPGDPVLKPWGVALCASMGAGALFGVVLSEGREVFWTMCIFGSFGAMLSIAFWGAIRVFSPLYFGMARRG
jgi:hypothetical protein